MAAASVRIFLGAQQLPLIRLARGALDRRKRRAVSSGCGRSAAASLTLEVTWTLRLQGLKPYTSLADLYEFVRASIRVGRNSRISSLRPSRALCKAPLRQRKVPAAQRRGCPPPRRWMALLCLWGAPLTPAVEIAARGTPRHATVRGGAGAAAIGLPLAVGGTIISAAPWSPQPQHHRKKKQRHRLC